MLYMVMHPPLQLWSSFGLEVVVVERTGAVGCVVSGSMVCSRAVAASTAKQRPLIVQGEQRLDAAAAGPHSGGAVCGQPTTGVGRLAAGRLLATGLLQQVLLPPKHQVAGLAWGGPTRSSS